MKREFSDVPFYFAHMRGADIRVECLRNGIYDWRSSRARPLKNMQAGRKTG